MAKQFLLSVPTSFGVESVAANEIRRLGYETERVEDGRISFWGGIDAICRCNLWLRVAERVQIKIGEFNAVTFDELYEGTRALPWSAVLPREAAFPVGGHSLKSKLFSVPDCQAIIKKAIVDNLSQKYKINRMPESGSLYKVQFIILRDRVSVYIDTSGEGLYKRGYRQASNIAPLRETLAAAIVYLSRWKPGMAFWDPFCGSGAIVIEAAMIGMNIAPGLQRNFTAETWGLIDHKNWKMAREEARALAGRHDRSPAPATESGNNTVGSGNSGRASAGSPTPAMGSGNNTVGSGNSGRASAGSPTPATESGNNTVGSGNIEIVGSDIEKLSVETSRRNAKKAGVSDKVKFFQLDVAKMKPYGVERLNEMGIVLPDRGCIVGNPPYGERMADLEAAEALYGKLGEQYKEFSNWRLYMISSNDDFEKMLRKKADKKRKLYNGMIKCNLYQYFG